MFNSSHFFWTALLVPLKVWKSEKWQRIQHICNVIKSSNQHETNSSKSAKQLSRGPIRYLSQSCSWIAYFEKPRCVLTFLLFYIVWRHGWKSSPYEMWVLSYPSIIWAWIMNEVAGSHFTIQLGSHLPCYWLIPYISQFQQQQLFQTKT